MEQNIETRLATLTELHGFSPAIKPDDVFVFLSYIKDVKVASALVFYRSFDAKSRAAMERIEHDENITEGNFLLIVIIYSEGMADVSTYVQLVLTQIEQLAKEKNIDRIYAQFETTPPFYPLFLENGFEVVNTNWEISGHVFPLIRKMVT